MFLAKLDIRKASDSVYQEAMARQVEIDVGEVANMPWEARAWVTLLRAGEMTIDFRGETFVLSQTNGVRHGSPDSPIAFGRIVSKDLEGLLMLLVGISPPLATLRPKTGEATWMTRTSGP